MNNLNSLGTVIIKQKYNLAREAFRLVVFGACLMLDKSEFFQLFHFEQSWNKLSWKLNKMKNISCLYFCLNINGKQFNFQFKSDAKYFSEHSRK